MPRYVNPWSSYRHLSAIEKLSSLSLRLKFPPETNERIPIRQKIVFPSSPPQIDDGPKIIWLGHASVYLLLPLAIPAEGREWRGILLDPVFSERCSPVSFLGPKRRIEAPCRVEELPRVDVVFISHDHYDHLDEASIKSVQKHHPAAQYFVPQSLGALLTKFGIDSTHVKEMNWWDEDVFSLSLNSPDSQGSSPGLKVERTVYMSASSPIKSQLSLSGEECQALSLSPVKEEQHIDEVPFSPKSYASPLTPSTLWDTVASSSTNKRVDDTLKIVCCPAQHNSGRKLFGKNKTLWCTWWIEYDMPNSQRWKCFFGGDTGYKSIIDGPTCPAFPLIRNRYGSPDLALLPIAHGSVLPYLQSLFPFIKFDAQRLTSAIHCSPSDAITLHQELSAKITMPIHWATWSTEIGTREIARYLYSACRQSNVNLKWQDQDDGSIPNWYQGVIVNDIGSSVGISIGNGLICCAE
ncbi:uncharacterized protein L199_007219 [Kwoniella botswanensis]|uniref:uncharacterized protein n=1 Tax=Kwoniella botswanensis TaxID=1268659 RepID=UPI00315CCC03